MDRGAWWATVSGAVMSQTRLKQLSTQHTVLPSFVVNVHGFGIFRCTFSIFT